MRPTASNLSCFISIILLSFCICGTAAAQPALTKAEKKLVSSFERRARNYVNLRKKVETATPKVKKDATPEEIEAYKDTLQKGVIAARRGAKQGDIFAPAIAPLLKRLIKRELAEYEKSEVRKNVMEADTKVALAINKPYPEEKELVQMSPPLLLALPQLPRELRYRFVGRSLVLMDRDGSLIIDFMREALP